MKRDEILIPRAVSLLLCHFFTDENALVGRLVDGRSADLVTLGKIAQVLVPAVCEFATTHQALILAAERRKIHNDLGALERQIEDKHASLMEKEAEVLEVVEALKQARSKVNRAPWPTKF